MAVLVLAMLVVLLLAGAVLLYAAYPYRGEETPVNPALGEAMKRGVRSLPTLDNEAAGASVPERALSAR